MFLLCRYIMYLQKCALIKNVTVRKQWRHKRVILKFVSTFFQVCWTRLSRRLHKAHSIFTLDPFKHDLRTCFNVFKHVLMCSDMILKNCSENILFFCYCCFVMFFCIDCNKVLYFDIDFFEVSSFFVQKSLK